MIHEFDDSDGLPFGKPGVNAVYADYYRIAAESNLGAWDKVKELLARHNPFQIMKNHIFLNETFGNAARAGQVDILRQMYAQGYKTDKKDATGILESLLKNYKEDLAETVSFLLHDAGAEPQSGLVALIAAEGSVAAMKVLKGAGCDILNDRSSFFLALQSHRTEMIRYLAAEGADLYHHINIALPGNFKSEKGRETLSAYRQLIEDDRLKCEEAQRGKNFNLDDYRSPAKNFEPGATEMHIAARAGHFSDVVAAALLEKQAPLTSADLLQKDNKGSSVLDILLIREELHLLFNARLWHSKLEEALPLHARLKKYDAGDKIDIVCFIAEAKRYDLQQRSRKNRPVLIRPPKP